MHELALASAIVDAVERHADGHRVLTVNVRVGRLRQVVPDSLEFCFGIVSRDGVCEGARLALEIVPAELRCDDCGHGWELLAPPFRCPVCGGDEVEVERGEEFLVESIEIEEDACIAPT
jgi:hydrogenase nickel incorporation protein HypA/HybF